MKRIRILILSWLLCFTLNSYGQYILFSEDFESGELPLNWNQEFVKGAINWRFEDGGYTLNPAIPNSRQPMTAHGGEYNALFQYQSMSNEATKLVTRKIESLEFAIKPELHFYNAQFEWKHGEDYYHDYLRVYFKNGASKPWTLLKSYTEVTTDWVERIILLPEGGMSDDCYLAFEGETKWGWGTCVDDIQIIETGILQKYLSNISIEQASLVSVASGTDNNPILKLKVKVMGNSGTLPLNTLTLKSLNTDDADIATGGVKLYHTTSAEFSTEEPIGSGVSFNSGYATFTGLNYDLPLGYSYIWITYDVKPDAGHRNTIDGKLEINSINIGGQTYFGEEKSPEGSRTVLQTIAFDDFESESDWVFTNEFEYGSPSGSGGSQGNPDPVSAYSGNMIIGSDLTGLGLYPGDYERNLSPDQCSAISDTFDLTYFTDLSIRYRRYLNIGVNDEAYIKVSPDNGATWKTAWSNTSMILDDSWKLHEVDITQHVARQKKVLVMYSIGSTNDYWQLSGWNIDDFRLTGKYVSKDVGISSVLSPLNGCGHSATDSITVVIKNYGATDSYGIIPLKFSIDGKVTMYRDTIKEVIPFGESKTFTFKKKIDLSVANIYNLYVSTEMANDDDRSNDALEQQVYIQPSLSANHTETFESKGGLWIKHDGNVPNWEWGIPGSGISPPSGSKVWKTRLLENYPDNDSSSIESACYTNEFKDRKMFSMKYWMETESEYDGMAIQYSADNGLSWQLIDTVITGWPWYNGPVDKLNSDGLSGNNGYQWKDIQTILPKEVTDAPSVKFRVLFVSNEANNDIGIAIDNFSIIKAPHDIGVTDITSHTDACQYINPDKLTVTVKNFGINPLRENDTIILGYDVNEVHFATDTFKIDKNVVPGATFDYTFKNPVDLNTPGNYKITAYSLLEKNPTLYGTVNDTTSMTFTIKPNPITTLLDTIQTRDPDTVLLETYLDGDYDYLWQDNVTTGNTYDVNMAGWYSVKVTDTYGNGCISYDSTYVELLFNDAGADSMLYPVNDCGLTKKEFLTVRIKNCGTDSINTGQKIAVAYEMNGGLPVVDTIQLSQTLRAYHTIDFTFDKAFVDLSQKGIYNFKIYTSYAGDTIPNNDTIVTSIEILGRPPVNLGPDKVVKALSYTIDAGSGFTSYLWDNGESNQTREISESGKYWVTVKDENFCDNSDTAFYWLKIRDIKMNAINSPGSGCHFSAGESIKVAFSNAGNDTLLAGEKIYINALFGSSTQIKDSITLGQKLLPGADLAHTFGSTLNLSNPGDYPLIINTVAKGDLKPSNDTLSTVIYRYSRPVVDFGLNNTEFIEDVSITLEAGYSPHYNYDWQDTATMHSYKVVTDGLYYVTATDSRTMCYDRDTVRIYLIYGDVGITWTDLPENACSGSFDHPTVRVKNLSPSAIGASAPIFVAVDINGSRAILDTLVRTTNFNPGAELDLVLSGPLNFTEENSRVDIYTLFEKDKKPENDTMVAAFSLLTKPVVDFGDTDGELEVDLPYVLDAGPGLKNYLWQNNSTGQTFTVNEPGTYSVIVTAENDCQTTKTVTVSLIDAVSTIEEAIDFSVYPNPNNGLFRIEMNNPDREEINLQIINNQGVTVFIRDFNNDSALDEEIDVQDLPQGLYHLIIRSGSRLYRGKIIIH